MRREIVISKGTVEIKITKKKTYKKLKAVGVDTYAYWARLF